MEQPIITLIAALDKNRAIGKGNALPWRIPQDMRRFKELTTGKPIIMGRKTAESLGKALPFRRNVVLSRNGHPPFAGMHGVRTVEEALNMAGVVPEIMIIGGGQIYSRFIRRAHRLLLTWVDTEIEGADAHFPAFREEDWKEVRRKRFKAGEKSPLGYAFADYRRQE